MTSIVPLIGSLVGAVLAAVLLWSVSQLRLGLEVENFAWAMAIGVLIGVVTTLVFQTMPNFDGVAGALVTILVSTALILVGGRVLRGLRINGYVDALLVAMVIALFNFGLGRLIRLLG